MVDNYWVPCKFYQKVRHIRTCVKVKGKGKVIPLQARCVPGGWVEIWLYSFMTAALEGGECSAARPGRTLPPRKTRYPFYRRLGGPQGRSGRAEILVPTGIRFRTFQPVAHSLYRLNYRAHIHVQVCKLWTVGFTVNNNYAAMLHHIMSSFLLVNSFIFRSSIQQHVTINVRRRRTLLNRNMLVRFVIKLRISFTSNNC